MLELSMFIAAISIIGCAWSIYQFRKTRQEHQMNLLLIASLQELFDIAQAEVNQNKNLLEKATAVAEGVRTQWGPADLTGENLLDDPGMLATLITALVNKYGTITLGIEDFTKLQDEDFVSVYIDTRTQDLILSLKANLTDQREVDFMRFNNPDDGTFH